MWCNLCRPHHLICWRQLENIMLHWILIGREFYTFYQGCGWCICGISSSCIWKVCSWNNPIPPYRPPLRTPLPPLKDMTKPCPVAPATVSELVFGTARFRYIIRLWKYIYKLGKCHNHLNTSKIAIMTITQSVKATKPGRYCPLCD